MCLPVFENDIILYLVFVQPKICTSNNTFQWCVYIISSARRHCPMYSCLSIMYESVNIIHLLLPMEYDDSLLMHAWIIYANKDNFQNNFSVVFQFFNGWLDAYMNYIYRISWDTGTIWIVGECHKAQRNISVSEHIWYWKCKTWENVSR
jgi:hypothetical protein